MSSFDYVDLDGTCECITCGGEHETCPDCGRPVANGYDSAYCDGGACGCPVAKSLCWRKVNDDVCCELSPYDPDAEGQ